MDKAIIDDTLRCLRRAYSRLDYNAFCELLGLNPKYSEKYFLSFHSGLTTLLDLDNTNIHKLVEWGEKSILED